MHVRAQGFVAGMRWQKNRKENPDANVGVRTGGAVSDDW